MADTTCPSPYPCLLKVVGKDYPGLVELQFVCRTCHYREEGNTG